MSQIISISDEVYATLKKMKKKNSYSEIIKTLLHKKTNKDNILECFGKGGIDNEKMKELNIHLI